MIKKIDHIGIAVKSIEKAKLFYEKVLGLECQGEEVVESQKVKTAFFSVGEVHIELLEPTSEDSPIGKFLSKNGEGVHHIAYATDQVEQQLKVASDENIKLINEKPIDGANGKKVAFLHPKFTFGVLTEFCQKEGK